MSFDVAITLIRLVEEYPVLYENVSGGKSDSSLVRRQAWSNIAERLNLPDAVCRRKWVHMRDALRRHLKIKLGITKTSRNTPYRNKYKYEDEMSFLLPYMNLPEEFGDELRSADVTHVYVNENSNSELESLQDAAAEEDGLIKKENIFKGIDDNTSVEPLSGSRRKSIKRHSYMDDDEYPANTEFTEPYMNLPEEFGDELRSADVTHVYVNENSNSELPARRKSIKRHSYMDDDEYPANTEFKEGIKMFLHSIESTLNNLNPYFLNKAKSDIFQVVQKYELQQIVDRQEHTSSSSYKKNKKTKKF